MRRTLRQFFIPGLLALSALSSASASAGIVNVNMTFDDIAIPTSSTGTPLFTALANYLGFTLGSATYVTGYTGSANHYLVTNAAIRITRTDNSGFYFNALDYWARGEDARKFYFIYQFTDGTLLNTGEAGTKEYFDTSFAVQTKLTDTSQQLRSLTIAPRKTDSIAEYTYIGLDNLQFGVEQTADNGDTGGGTGGGTGGSTGGNTGGTGGNTGAVVTVSAPAPAGLLLAGLMLAAALPRRRHSDLSSR